MKYRQLARTIIAGSCLIFIVFGYAGPKDFWASKPYTDWTASEVEKLLNKKSPWTHVQLLLPASGGGGRSSRPSGSEQPSYPVPVYISWNSRLIREAIVRKTTLENPETPKDQLDRVLNYKPQHLEILVAGQLLSAGRGADREEELAKFKEKTFLQKKNKAKIPLANVVMPANRNAFVTLQFPREVNGEPTVVPEDKEITLNIKIGDNVYKYTFKYADMMVGSQLEI